MMWTAIKLTVDPSPQDSIGIAIKIGKKIKNSTNRIE